MARFWASNIASKPISCSAFTVMHDPDVITKEELKACISTVKEAFTHKGSAKGRFVLPDDCQFVESRSGMDNVEEQLKKKHVVFGEHPHSIYVIWINRDVRDDLDRGFRRSAYKPEAKIDAPLTDLKQDPSQDTITETEITRLRINAAHNCGPSQRRPSQEEVMNMKANDVCNAP
jgi:hypothetical protein